MKAYLLSLSLLFTGVAYAGMAQLSLPPSLANVGQPAVKSCAGNAFAGDGSVIGACRTVTVSACSGRGCAPVSYTTTYVATWDDAGLSTSVTACSVARRHRPQPTTFTYAPGYDAVSCPEVDLAATGTVYTIDGTPFYYVTTDPTTGAVLVNLNTWGYVYTP